MALRAIAGYSDPAPHSKRAMWNEPYCATFVHPLPIPQSPTCRFHIILFDYSAEAAQVGGIRLKEKSNDTEADRPLPVVRRQGRGGRELLRLGLQELEDRPRRPLHRGRPRSGGVGLDCRVRDRRAAVHGAQRRSRVHLQRGGLLLDRTARTRRRSTTTGTHCSRMAASRASAAGSRTSTASRGRSSRTCSTSCCAIPTRSEPVRRCGR